MWNQGTGQKNQFVDIRVHTKTISSPCVDTDAYMPILFFSLLIFPSTPLLHNLVLSILLWVLWKSTVWTLCPSHTHTHTHRAGWNEQGKNWRRDHMLPNQNRTESAWEIKHHIQAIPMQRISLCLYPIHGITWIHLQRDVRFLTTARNTKSLPLYHVESVSRVGGGGGGGGENGMWRGQSCVWGWVEKKGKRSYCWHKRGEYVQVKKKHWPGGEGVPQSVLDVNDVEAARMFLTVGDGAHSAQVVTTCHHG